MEGQSLQLMTDEELLNEVSRNLPGLLSYPETLKNLRLKFLSLPLASRKILAQKITAALKTNNQSLGAFMVTNKGLRMPPLISNWLKDFIDFSAGKINKTEDYLSSLRNQNIPEKTLILLKNIFGIYEFINEVAEKPASLETIVIKDKDGRLKIMKQGKLEEFSPARPSVKEEKNIPPPIPSLPPERKDLPPAKTEKPVEETKEVELSPVTEEVKNQLKTVSLEPSEKSTANSYLDPEDDEEIKNHEKNLSSFPLSDTLSVDEVINQIISKYNLVFEDDILKKRFFSIAGSRLKEIRTESDTFDLLTRSSKIGGLEYPEDQAENIITDLRNEIPRLHALKPQGEARPKIPVPTPKEALAATLEKEKIFKPVPEEPESTQDTKEMSDEEKISPIKEALAEPVKTQAQVLFEKALSKLREEAEQKNERENISTPINIQRPSVISQKPRLEDIKGKAKISGPVEELRMLSLNDFRRIGSDRVSAVRKVYDKINLLKEDSFTRFAAGVKAWRESEVYQLYLEMGRQSMERARTIREVVEERTASGQPYLTEKEFSDLADLNKELRF
ncbi:MAG: hypothetical protein ABIH38_03150 [Patescibacteria group bacterium]